MCRIIMYLEAGKKRDERKIEHICVALAKSDYQGGHGVGVLLVDRDGRAKALKFLATGEEVAKLIYTKYRKAVYESPLIIIHNRLATHGDKTERNTHPIAKNGVYVVHNGVISRYLKFKSENSVSDTDSEAILDVYLSSSSFSEFKDKLGELGATQNFILYDSNTKRLFIRDDGAIDIGYNEESNTYMIVSEWRKMMPTKLRLYKRVRHYSLFGESETNLIVKKLKNCYKKLELLSDTNLWEYDFLGRRITNEGVVRNIGYSVYPLGLYNSVWK